MGYENYSINHNAKLAATAGATTKGFCLVKTTAGDYVVATSANRALYGRKAAGIALKDADNSLVRCVDFQLVGVLGTDLTGLSAGTANESLTVSTTGRLVRASDATATSEVVGRADADGTAYVLFGAPLVTSGSALPAPPADGYVLRSLGGSPVWLPPTPDMMALTGHWRDFNSAPWLGTMSQGPSGLRSLAAGTAPTVGADFGTHPSASFNGTTSVLTGTTFAYDRYFSASGYFIQVDFQATAAGAPGGSAIADPGLWGDNQGNLYLTFSTSGLRAGHYDGAYKTTAFVACSTGARHCAQMWHDGTTVSLRVDGGSVVTVAAGAMASQNLCFPRVGANWNASAFFNGLVGRVLVANNPLNSTLRDALRADSVANFGTI